jgi:hypothetical protein
MQRPDDALEHKAKRMAKRLPLMRSGESWRRNKQGATQQTKLARGGGCQDDSAPDGDGPARHRKLFERNGARLRGLDAHVTGGGGDGGGEASGA